MGQRQDRAQRKAAAAARGAQEQLGLDHVKVSDYGFFTLGHFWDKCGPKVM